MTYIYIFIDLLGKHWQELIVFDPADGFGGMTDPLVKNGLPESNVIRRDLVTREEKHDYLLADLPSEYDVTICNPPWCLAKEFVRQAFFSNKPFVFLLNFDLIGSMGMDYLFNFYGIKVCILCPPPNFIRYSDKKAIKPCHNVAFFVGNVDKGVPTNVIERIFIGVARKRNALKIHSQDPSFFAESPRDATPRVRSETPRIDSFFKNITSENDFVTDVEIDIESVVDKCDLCMRLQHVDDTTYMANDCIRCSRNICNSCYVFVDDKVVCVDCFQE